MGNNLPDTTFSRPIPSRAKQMWDFSTIFAFYSPQKAETSDAMEKKQVLDEPHHLADGQRNSF